jgi:hypothetical protein
VNIKRDTGILVDVGDYAFFFGIFYLWVVLYRAQGVAGGGGGG